MSAMRACRPTIKAVAKISLSVPFTLLQFAINLAPFHCEEFREEIARAGRLSFFVDYS